MQGLINIASTPDEMMDLDLNSCDVQVEAAKLESIRSGCLTPLIKLELKCRIQTKRLSEGQCELDVEFSPPAKTQLTDEEQQRRKKRQHQNKMAATKCRVKRKEELKQLYQTKEMLQNRNEHLKKQIKGLEETINELCYQYGRCLTTRPYPQVSTQRDAHPHIFLQRCILIPSPCFVQE